MSYVRSWGVGPFGVMSACTWAGRQALGCLPWVTDGRALALVVAIVKARSRDLDVIPIRVLQGLALAGDPEWRAARDGLAALAVLVERPLCATEGVAFGGVDVVAIGQVAATEAVHHVPVSAVGLFGIGTVHISRSFQGVMLLDTRPGRVVVYGHVGMERSGLSDLAQGQKLGAIGLFDGALDIHEVLVGRERERDVLQAQTAAGPAAVELVDLVGGDGVGGEHGPLSAARTGVPPGDGIG